LAREKLTPKQEAAYRREKARRALEPVYYVYLLVDPRDGKPFYVGKGIGHRHLGHAKKSLRRGNPRTGCAKSARIRDIHKCGLAVEYEFPFQCVTEPKAMMEERRLIRSLPGLLNKYRGGYSEAERGLAGIEQALRLARTPTQWVRAWLCEFKRVPTAAEMDEYTNLHLGHLALRATLRRALMIDASSRQPTA
jgi:hypothetical protein